MNISLTPFPNKQRGLALIATLLVVAVFTFIAMSIATKSKKNQALTGATVRHHVVFEAAEMTLRKAMRFIRSINVGEPKVGDNADISTNADLKNLVENFEMKTAQDNAIQFVTQPDYAFIWDTGKLQQAVCGTCSDGFSFVKSIDDSNLWHKAIKSTFSNKDFGNHYLSHVQTYTFIELLRDTGADASMYSADGRFISGAGRTVYYLITVKSSGFPPNTDKNDLTNARENVVIQAVYAQTY